MYCDGMMYKLFTSLANNWPCPFTVYIQIIMHRYNRCFFIRIRSDLHTFAGAIHICFTRIRINAHNFFVASLILLYLVGYALCDTVFQSNILFKKERKQIDNKLIDAFFIRYIHNRVGQFFRIWNYSVWWLQNVKKLNFFIALWKSLIIFSSPT